MKYARNLPDTDGWWNNPDPYVKIQARHSTGSVSTQYTRYISGETSPDWYKTLDFGCTYWAYSEIQVWDSDDNADDAMSNKELVCIQPGYHPNERHNAHGNGYLIYNYKFILDGNECSWSPCQNDGTCIEQCAGYYCHCRNGYIGTRCEHHTGRLRAYARYGRNLPDVDGWLNDSDPYIEFTAVDHTGRSFKKKTNYKQGNHNPNWYQWIDFGYRSWRSLRVRVYDSDHGADDPMSGSHTFHLNNPGVSRKYVSRSCSSGYVVFDFSYV